MEFTFPPPNKQHTVVLELLESREPKVFFLLWDGFVCNHFNALPSNLHKDFKSYILQNCKCNAIALIGKKKIQPILSLQVLFRFFIQLLGFLKYLSSNLHEKAIWIIIPTSLLLHISTSKPVHSVIPMVLKTALKSNLLQQNCELVQP